MIMIFKMVETRHVRLDFEEAMNAKKELLNLEMNLLKIGKKLKAYKNLRKREFAEKGKFKNQLSALKRASGLFLSSLPKESLNEEQKKEKSVKREKGDDFYKELDEIKKKLEKLEK